MRHAFSSETGGLAGTGQHLDRHYGPRNLPVEKLWRQVVWLEEVCPMIGLE